MSINVNGLPEELTKQLALGGGRANGPSPYLPYLKAAAGKGLTLNEIIINVYNSEQRIVKRQGLSAHMKRLEKAGTVVKVTVAETSSNKMSGESTYVLKEFLPQPGE